MPDCCLCFLNQDNRKFDKCIDDGVKKGKNVNKVKIFFVFSAMLLSCSWGYAQDLTVSAAGSLSSAFKEVATVFEKENSNVHVVLNFAAAGVLVKQMEQGAPIDVFASADQMNMNKAQTAGLINVASRKNFVQNTLVVAVPKNALHVPGSLDDLKEDVYKLIALGRPGITPAGNYMQDVLKEKKLWSLLEPKFIFAEHVTQVIQYLVHDEADVGFVFVTDASKYQDTVRVAFAVSSPEDFIYPIARTEKASQPELAERFIHFVTSPQGQTILKKHGFAVITQ